MKYLVHTNPWGNLIFSTGNALTDVVSSATNWRIRQDKSELVFKNPRYKSVVVFAAKQLLMSQLEGNLNQLIPKFKKALESKARDEMLAQQEANQKVLIANQEANAADWGVVHAEGGHDIHARDKYGTLVPEALMVYYDAEESHKVTDEYEAKNKNKELKPYDTKTVCHIDLSPQVSMNSSKNIVMTQVQGRDYTRKELVSGGDLQFSINGNIVSNERGVYPTEAVKKFVQIMEYNGILNVNFMMFQPFNVTRIIVKDYSLSQQTYKNVQPYSFNCVAIEPDEDVKVSADTISVINKELSESPMDAWYSVILDNKIAQSIANTATSMATYGAGLGLDKIATNI